MSHFYLYDILLLKLRVESFTDMGYISIWISRLTYYN